MDSRYHGTGTPEPQETRSFSISEGHFFEPGQNSSTRDWSRISILLRSSKRGERRAASDRLGKNRSGRKTRRDSFADFWIFRFLSVHIRSNGARIQLRSSHSVFLSHHTFCDPLQREAPPQRCRQPDKRRFPRSRRRPSLHMKTG